MSIDKTLPESVNTYLSFLAHFSGQEKYRVAQMVNFYMNHDPEPWLQWARPGGDSLVKFSAMRWPYLYAHYLLDETGAGNRAVLLHYVDGNGWIYRGPIWCERDMFGPVWVTIEDELRLMNPIFTPENVLTAG